ncbi:terminase small subunit [Ligilactobacillus apodemi]|uniref:Prophage lp2 protein 34 n=1 Tax=Ligilactobacillus apodemi DSM 16634 = JCM 16172 TaxID=1423724 RepID=A0A0R1U097_9LACO|nr:terminase small subunit [Ligilactobacillus apodemi]KRL84595.1 prophage lp2 protein 34 [Ligilactobacillus apodemi DSM 16634 = JCM 16172]
MKKLTPKQKAFADEYIKSGNIYQSAVKAGYSEAYAKSLAGRMLENARIKSYIDAKMAEIESHKIADAKEQKEADLKTRISAAREIMKRYPGNDPFIAEQIRKLKAEADSAEAKAMPNAFEVQIRQEEFGTDEDEERTDDLASAVQDGMKGVFGNGDEIET